MERELKEIRDEVESLQREEHTRLEREKKTVLDRIKDEVWHVMLQFFWQGSVVGSLTFLYFSFP